MRFVFLNNSEGVFLVQNPFACIPIALLSHLHLDRIESKLSIAAKSKGNLIQTVDYMDDFGKCVANFQPKSQRPQYWDVIKSNNDKKNKQPTKRKKFARKRRNHEGESLSSSFHSIPSGDGVSLAHNRQGHFCSSTKTTAHKQTAGEERERKW